MRKPEPMLELNFNSMATVPNVHHQEHVQALTPKAPPRPVAEVRLLVGQAVELLVHGVVVRSSTEDLFMAFSRLADRINTAAAGSPN